MKKNTLKILGISFLIFVLLSWIVPVGTYSGGKVTTDGINPVGLTGLFNTPVNTLLTFALYGVTFAVIGGLYGVMEKTGALDVLVDRWAKRFEKKSSRFIVLTVVLFTLLSSVTGLIIPLFVLVPLFAAVLFKLNYDKVTVLAATVGSLLLGSVASTYGFNITGYTKNVLSVDMNNQIVAKIILLVLLTVLLAVTVVTAGKKKKVTKSSAAEEVKEVKKEVKGKTEAKKTTTKSSSKSSSKTSSKTSAKSSSKSSSKTSTKSGAKKTTKKPAKKTTTKALAVAKSVKKVSNKPIKVWPMLLVLTLMLIVSFVAMYNWYYSFEIELFSDIHEAVMGVKIKDFAIFESLFNGVSQFGYWGNTEFVGLMLAASVLIGLIYKLKITDLVDGFADGVKKWMPTAIYSTLASVILVVLYQSIQYGSGTLVDTINGKLFGLADGFSPVITGISTLLSSFFFNDLYYLLSDLSNFVKGFDKSSLSIAAFLVQSIYGVAMMIFPTSVILIAGLSYFEVSYGKWMKYMWRFLLIAFLAVLLVCGILTLM